MDSQTICTSSLPQIWAIETLACCNQIDISLLLDLLEKTPDISNDIGRNARESVSLKILESFSVRGAHATPVSPAARHTIRLDPSNRCEDALLRILSSTSLPDLISAGPEMLKWDLKPFIEHKKLNLPKTALERLKDAILSGSNPILASLKEQCGLFRGNQYGSCNDFTPGIEGSVTNDSFLLPKDFPEENIVRANLKRRATCEIAAEELCATHIESVKKYKHDIICTDQDLAGKSISFGVDRKEADNTIGVQHIEGSFVVQRKSHAVTMELNEPCENDNEFTSSKAHVGPDEVLPGGKQVAHSDTEYNDKSEEQGQRMELNEPCENDNEFTSSMAHVGPEVLPGGKQVAHSDAEYNGKSEEQGQTMELNEPCENDNEFTSSKKHVGRDDVLPGGKQVAHSDAEYNDKSEEQEQSMELNEPCENDNEITSSKAHVGPDEVLPGRNLVAHSDTEFNDKSEEQGHDLNIVESKGDEKEFSDLKKSNQKRDKFMQDTQSSGEVEEIINLSDDNDGNDAQMTDVAKKENSCFGLQCRQQDSLSTDCRFQNLLAGTSKLYSGEGRCSTDNNTPVEVMEKNENSGSGNNQFTSSKGIVANDEVPPENLAQRCGTEIRNANSDRAVPHSIGESAENVRKDLGGLTTMNTGTYKFDHIIERTTSIVGGAEDIDKSNDNDGFQVERNNIDIKKKIFLSSQCTYSQDSMATSDCRELHICMKCNKGGELLSCSSDSCPLVIHESCLDSDPSFDASGKFYCPFCAYSQAISKYMEAKEKSSLKRKELTTFFCPDKEHSEKSFMIKDNHFQQTCNLPENKGLNQTNVAEKVGNHQGMKKLEQAGPSEVRSGTPFVQKSVGSFNRLAQSLNKENQDGQSLRAVSQSLRVNGQQQLAAPEICIPQGDTTSTAQVPNTSGSKNHADVKHQREVRLIETNLPCEHKCSENAQSSDPLEFSEENDHSGTSQYIIRPRKQKMQNLNPAFPQIRRRRIPWTNEEEDMLREGVRLFTDPDDKVIPWKKIWEHGQAVFQSNRSAIDLKDKWRNMCKATSSSK